MKNIKYIFFAACLLVLNSIISAQTVYTVTKSADPDPFVNPYNFNDSLCSTEMYGTLQWAIRKANDTEGPCRIIFNILGQAPHTISLGYYFPQITNSVIIDATTQPGYTVGEPSIIIDGQNLISTAFYVFEADSVEIKGFRINRMKSAGIILHYCNDVIISDNIISLPNANYNLSKLGFNRIKLMQCSNIYIYNNVLDAIAEGIPTPGPYNYGIAVYGTTNCFIGDAGTNNSNSIVNCYNGVYLDALSQAIKISGNIINGGSTGISLTSGSNNNKKSPMILGYEEGVLKGVGIDGDVIEVFGSTGAEKSLIYLGTTITDSDGNWSMNTTTTYEYSISTATDINNNTSKFSNALLLNPTCALPTNLSSTTGLSTNHTLYWDGPNGATFNVAVGVKDLTPLDNSWMISYSQTTGDSIVISGLDQNIEYEYYINSNCGAEVSHWAGPLEFNITNSSTTKLIDEQCNTTVLYGTPIVAIPIENRDNYEFVFYNEVLGLSDTIISNDNYLSLEEYKVLPRYEYLNVKVLTTKNNVRSNYGDICMIKIILDCGFDEILKNTLNNNFYLQTEIEQNIADIVEIASAKELEIQEPIKIPIVFHVIVPEEETNAYNYLAPDKIYQSLQALNNVFSGVVSNDETAIDTKISFCPLKSQISDPSIPINCVYNGITYFGITYNFINDDMDINLPNNPEYPLSCFNPSESSNEYYADFPREKVLNVWIFDTLYASTVCGFAWSDAFNVNPDISSDIYSIGYVVIKKEVVGLNQTFSRMLGFTLPHEVGHYLGLLHPWNEFLETECEEDADNIDDTPNCSEPSNGCDESLNTCTNDTENDPIHNIMNYSPDGCRNHLTEGQANYMHTTVELFYNVLPYNPAEDNFEIDCDIPQSIIAAQITNPIELVKCVGGVNIEVFYDDATDYHIEIFNPDLTLSTVYQNEDATEVNLSESTAVFFHSFTELGSHQIKLILTDDYGNTFSVNREITIVECPSYNGNMQTAHWHYDQLGCLDFTNGIAQLGETQIHASDNETSVCKSDGTLLFYTNGADVWDYNHNLISDFSFSGDTEISKGIIALTLNESDDYSTYMIVTITENFKLNYQVIKIDSEHNIATIIEPTPLLSNPDIVVEGLSACPIPDGTGYWIISSTKNNNPNYPILIRILNVAPYITDEILVYNDLPLSVPLDESTLETTIKVSPNGKYVVYQSPEAGTKFFFFNAQAGVLTDFSCTIDNANGKLWESAFSYDSRYLYLTDVNFDGNIFKILQFDLNTLDICNCVLFGNTIFEANSNENIEYTKALLFLQEGPDNRIYFTRKSDIAPYSRNVGVILQPTNAGTISTIDNECNTVDNFIVYPNDTYIYNDYYLPNFVDAKPKNCDLDFRVCSNNCLDLEIINLSHGENEQFKWTINDGTSDFYQNFVLIPDLNSFTSSDYLEITLSKVGCSDSESITETVDTENYTNSILGDYTICNDDQSHLYFLNNEINTAQWFINGVSYGVGAQIEISGSNPQISDLGSFILSANVTNQFGCNSVISETINIHSFNYGIISDFDCSLNDGSASINISGSSISYTSVIDGQNYNLINGTNSPLVGLASGTHQYTISDDICNYSGEFVIDEPVNLDYNLELTECHLYTISFSAIDPDQLSNYSFNVNVNGLLYSGFPGTFTISAEGTGDIIIPALSETPVLISVNVVNILEPSCQQTYYIVVPKNPDIYIIPTFITPYYCEENPGDISLLISGSLATESFDFSLILNGVPIPLPESYQFISTTNDGIELYIENLQSGNYQIKIPFQSNSSICYFFGDFIIPDGSPVVTPSVTYDCSSNCGHSILLEIESDTSNPLMENVAWQTGDQTTLIEIGNNIYQTSYNDLCSDVYTYTIDAENGCKYNGSVDVKPLSTPQIEIPKCLYLSNSFHFIDLANSDPSLTWTWSIGDEIIIGGNELIYEFSEYGYYTLFVTVGSEQCGYISSERLIIFVNPDICACDENDIFGGLFEYQPAEQNIIASGSVVSWNTTIPEVSETRFVQGDVIIEPTAILTIGNNLRVEFAPNSRIVVMAAGKLIIEDNVTLSSIYDPLCEDNMWQGIEVWGDNDYPHDMEKQGIVEILDRNNVVIENAHIGIFSGSRNFEYLNNSTANPNPFDSEKGCGLVQLGGGNILFQNNGTCIKFLSREPIISIGAFWSGNFLDNCTFITSVSGLNDFHYSSYYQNHYPNSQNPWAGYANQYQRTDVGIYINGIKGLNVNECTFDNMQYGILSYDSRFNVQNNSQFTKMIYGIKLENTYNSIINSHEISQCFFDKIPGFPASNTSKLATAAICITAGYNDYIHNNTFGDADAIQKFNHFGIVTSGSSVFEITENLFRNFDRGIVTTTSGLNGGFIGAENNSLTSWGGNRFIYSWRSITTQGYNPKLRLKCNTSINNQTDANAYSVNYLNTGTLANQGSPSPLGISYQKQRFPAGNEFFPDNQDYYKRLSSTEPYQYYYYRHSGPEAVIPYIDDNNEALIHVNSTNAVLKISNAAACPDPIWGHIVVGGIRLPDLQVSLNNLIQNYPFKIIDSLQNANDSLTLVKNNLNLNLDDGKTAELLNDIYGTMAQGRLMNKLITASPLSDTVIYALLTEYPLSHGNFKNVMLLNLPVNQNLEYLLYTVLTQIPTGISNQLIEMQAYNPFSNTPGKLEQEIKDVELEKQLLLNRFIRLLTDTTHNRYDDAIRLLEAEQNVPADKILTGTYISKNDYISATDKISLIPDGIKEDQDFKELNGLVLSYFEQKKSFYELDSTKLEYLWQLAYECPLSLSGANAQSILSLLYRAEFEDCPPAMGTRNAKIYDAHLNAPEDPEEFSLGDNYPDPADNYTIIPYNLGQENGILVISDVSGKEISTNKLNFNEHEFFFNTQNLVPGIYNYTIILESGNSTTKKFAIYR